MVVRKLLRAEISTKGGSDYEEFPGFVPDCIPSLMLRVLPRSSWLGHTNRAPPRTIPKCDYALWKRRLLNTDALPELARRSGISTVTPPTAFGDAFVKRLGANETFVVEKTGRPYSCT
ncbi:hypothetical protein PM082_001836 [Marasmius tenuissimus]|nr:hypothetical protein PM082_001836 [Marasmius tenuissimus]